MMGRERGFTTVSLFRLTLPVAIASVQDREQRGYPQEAKSSVCARYEIRIFFGYGIHIW